MTYGPTTIHYKGAQRSQESVDRIRSGSAARQRALRVVARMHAEEFAALWTERGSVHDPGYSTRRDAARRAVAHNHPEDFARVFSAEKAR